MDSLIDNWTRRFDLMQLQDAIWSPVNKGQPLSDIDRAAALRAGEDARLAGGGNVGADMAMRRFVRDLLSTHHPHANSTRAAHLIANN